jgi:hypothetical protein
MACMMLRAWWKHHLTLAVAEDSLVSLIEMTWDRSHLKPSSPAIGSMLTWMQPYKAYRFLDQTRLTSSRSSSRLKSLQQSRTR